MKATTLLKYSKLISFPQEDSCQTRKDTKNEDQTQTDLHIRK